MTLHRIRLFLIFISALVVSFNVHAGELIPFPLPWDDSQASITDVSYLLEKPAGKNGFIQIKDGRFVDGTGKSFRILGVNNSFAGNYPTHEQAEAVAARLAKYGINCVRFHHTDTSRAPRGIWRADTKTKQELDPQQLDRMDYFIAALKRNGVYTNINLKIGREAVEADGIPFADDLPKYDKGPDHFYPRLIELQKQYARDLLTHRNPYTGNRYVDEPAIATIEINNESGLVNKWQAGDLDDLPDECLEPLRMDWNRFLRKKYDSTEDLLAAWTPELIGSGGELLSRGLRGWTFQQSEEGKGRKELVNAGPNGKDALRVTTTSVGRESWHVQIFYPNLSVQKEAFYRVEMWLRASQERDVSVGMKMDHSPWENLDSSRSIDVGTDWTKYEFSFSPSQTDSDARLDISDLGDELGSLWVSDVSMKEGLPQTLSDDENLEKNAVQIMPRDVFAGRSPAAKRDWIEFLVERESQYYRDMVDYLHGELGVKCPVAGTQLGFGVLPSQMENDFIDIHGYWHHPSFPGRSWDASNWYVRNESIVNELDSVLARLMLSQVEGRAYTVSEYNHPAPNTCSSEGIPLIAAYGAFHEWDGIYYYSYSHSNEYDEKSINSFFDIYGHTPKMLAMPTAAHLFLRKDISSAEDVVIAAVERDEFIDLLTDRNGSTWGLSAETFGIPELTPYLHRIVMRFGQNLQSPDNPTVRDRRRLVSDTNELIWNRQRPGQHYVLIRSAKTQGFIGFVAEDEFELRDNVRLNVGPTMQNWANVLLTFVRSDEEGDHWLLTATGYHENKGMEWKSDAKDSVGRNWGSGPPLVEAIPLRLSFSDMADVPQVFALDNRGQRSKNVSKLASIEQSEAVVVDLMDEQPSLWYEIVFEKQNISGAEKY